jgi:DNA-binding IclR family transcriptional regulator
VTDRAEIESLLEKDRSAGYTISVGQQIPLAAGAAAAFDCLGVTGSISITRPRYLTDDDDLLRFGPMTQQTARAIETSCTGAASAPDGRPIEYPAGSTALERIIRLVTALIAEPTGTGTERSLATGLAVPGDGRLLPGPRLLHWAACLGPDLNIPSTARHILLELAEQTGETIGLTQLHAETREAEMTSVIPGRHPLHYGLASGIPIPLHAGAAGKAILAHCPPEHLDDITLQQFTERTPTDRTSLLADLQVIRERGWATGNGERIPDAFGVSAPYFIDGTIAGSITATIARIRLPDLDLEALARAVLQASQRLTRLLTLA